MMRTKKFAILLSYQEECIAFLEQKSREGWKLDRIGLLDVKFCKCSRPLKYQIGYGEYDYEYLSIIKELGYEVMSVYKKMYIFATEDLNAPDLETDYEVYKETLLSIHPMYLTPALIALGFLIDYFLLYRFIGFFPLSLGEIYLSYKSILLDIAFFVFGFAAICIGGMNFLKRKSIMEETYTYEHWCKVDIWSERIISILSSFVAIMLVAANTQSVMSIVLTALFLLVRFVVRETEKFYIEQKGKKIVLFSLGFLMTFAFINVIVEDKNDRLYSFDYPKTFPRYDSVIDIGKNIFVEQVIAISDIENNELKDNYARNYYNCMNELVAKEIFQYEIMNTERLIRMPENEAIHQIFIKSGKLEMKKTLPVSYEDALVQYNKYDSQLFEECYKINDFIVARNENIVVRLVIEENDVIDDILRSYMNF